MESKLPNKAQSIRAFLAQAYKTEFKEKDLIPVAGFSNFYKELNIIPDLTVDAKVKNRKIVEELKVFKNSTEVGKGKEKLLEIIKKHLLPKYVTPSESQEVKESGGMPFSEDKKQSFDEALNEAGIPPLSSLPPDVYNNIVYAQPPPKTAKQKEKEQREAKREQIKKDLQKKVKRNLNTERTDAEILQEFKKPPQIIIDPKILAQEQEIKDIQTKLASFANIARVAEINLQRNQQETQKLIESTKGSYNNMLSEERKNRDSLAKQLETERKAIELERKTKLSQQKQFEEKLKELELEQKQTTSLKRQIEDLKQAELNRQNLEYNVWDVLDIEDEAEAAKAKQQLSELEQKRIEKELKKTEFEKARIASELKQTVEVKEQEQKNEPIINYLDNITPYLSAPLLVLAGNLLAGSNKNVDNAMATVLSSGTLALMTYLRSIYRPEEVKQAIQDARTLKPDKRVNKILKQAQAVPKPEPEPDPDPGPSGPSGDPENMPDEKGIDNRLIIAGGAAMGIGGGMLARKAYDTLPNFRQFFKGDFTLPGYNFLGPGTDLKQRIMSGLEPVNTLDKIAYEHDLLYSIARNPAQIREADQNMINAIDKYLKGDILANMVKEIIYQKINFEKESLFDFSNKILEENKQTTKQQRQIYDNLLNAISYEQQPAQPIEPTQQPAIEQDIKTTEPDNIIVNMDSKSTVQGPQTQLETKSEQRGNIRTAPVLQRPVIYNPPPPIGPDRSRISGVGGPGRPYKTTTAGAQVAPLAGTGFPDRTVIDQSDYINDDEIKRGPGILKPKFIMPSVNILNRTEQEQYVDDLEFAMFDFVQDDSGGNDPNGTNPLLRDQNISLGLRYQRAGMTINSLFGENLPDDPQKMPAQRVQQLLLGKSRLPEMKFLFSQEFEAQEFNLSEFEVDQYDVNNERTAIEMLSPYSEFTDNQLLDQFIDTSVLYGICP